MQYLVVVALVAGAIGWAVFASEPLQQVAAIDGMPRQISQLTR